MLELAWEYHLFIKKHAVVGQELKFNEKSRLLLKNWTITEKTTLMGCKSI